MRKYLSISAYLYVYFGVLQLYKVALLQNVGVHYLPLGVAVVKALTVGKFLLIGDAVQGRVQHRPGHLTGRIARRVLWLLAILALLTGAEELIVGWIHGHSIAEMQTAFHSWSMLELVAEILLVGLFLVPVVAAVEVGQALGPEALRRLLLRPAAGNSEATDTRDPGST